MVDSGWPSGCTVQPDCDPVSNSMMRSILTQAHDLNSYLVFAQCTCPAYCSRFQQTIDWPSVCAHRADIITDLPYSFCCIIYIGRNEIISAGGAPHTAAGQAQYHRMSTDNVMEHGLAKLTICYSWHRNPFCGTLLSDKSPTTHSPTPPCTPPPCRDHHAQTAVLVL